MPKIKLRDAEFYYELYGEGHPLILIAGYTCDHTAWYPVVETLSKKYQVLIFDNRACGQTVDSGCSLDAKLMAEDVIALSRALNLKKPHIVGQSMGGTIAQAVGIHFGEEISKLVLLTTVPKWRQAMIRACLSLFKERDKLPIDDQINSILAWMTGEAFLQNSDKVDFFKKCLIENSFPQSVEDQLRQFEMMKNFDAREDLRKIEASTLCVYSEEDIIALPHEVKKLASNIKNATVASCKGAHCVVLEYPEDLCEIILKFLA